VSGSAEQFKFIARDPALGSASLAPMMPITIRRLFLSLSFFL
jgi:hypothetical protein